MNYNQKNIIATIFLKQGEVVRSFQDHTPVEPLEVCIRRFQDNGLDKIYLFDLSDDEKEHEEHLQLIHKTIHMAELPVYVGGHIESLEDVKRMIYAGCKKVILNSLKTETVELADLAAKRFGKERLALSVYNVDVFFKQKQAVGKCVSEIIMLDDHMAGTMGDVTDMPYSIYMNNISREKIAQILTSEKTIQGISCAEFSDAGADVMGLKKYLAEQSIPTGHLTSTMRWSDFKLNSDGLVPVIVQDYRTNDVLMLAYMNEEAYLTTLSLGKMTYYSRSRQELWIKGLTSGHFQYVKSLTIDCDNDTILAKVSQVGAACHTGNRSCFFTNLASSETGRRNLYKVLEETFEQIVNRKKYPREGSYTSDLFDQGLDEILKKVGNQSLEILLSSKNTDKEDMKNAITDYIYYLMVLMAEKDLSVEEVLEGLTLR